MTCLAGLVLWAKPVSPQCVKGVALWAAFPGLQILHSWLPVAPSLLCPAAPEDLPVDSQEMLQEEAKDPWKL